MSLIRIISSVCDQPAPSQSRLDLFLLSLYPNVSDYNANNNVHIKVLYKKPHNEQLGKIPHSRQTNSRNTKKALKNISHTLT